MSFKMNLEYPSPAKKEKKKKQQKTSTASISRLKQ